MQTIRDNNPRLKFYDLSAGVQWIGGEIGEIEEAGEMGEGDHHHDELDSTLHLEHSPTPFQRGNLNVEHHHHGGIDPHIWSATGTAKLIAHNTLRAFQDLDPEHQLFYQENYQRLLAEIEATAQQLHRMLDTLACRTFVIYHPALTYFADEYNLRQLSIESDGKEPSVASMKNLIDEARKAQVRVVFVQQEFDRKHAEQVAAEIGARVAVINPLDRQWKEQMLHVARELIK
jgi:zinc transport system substrate-binding protein